MEITSDYQLQIRLCGAVSIDMLHKELEILLQRLPYSYDNSRFSFQAVGDVDSGSGGGRSSSEDGGARKRIKKAKLVS